MPELPEVETIRLGLVEALVGKQIEQVEVKRASIIHGEGAEFASNLKGKTVLQVDRKGKYLIFTFDQGGQMLAHLGMSGKFIFSAGLHQLAPHDRAIFHLQGGSQLIFSELRCFGFLEWVEQAERHPRIMKLGCDALDKKLTPQMLTQAWAKTTQPIKTLLLQQSPIAGIGNIYAAEILFAAKIHPLVAGSKLGAKRLLSLIEQTRRILKLALVHNGTSISDFRRVDDKTGAFQDFLQVYSKAGEPCPLCGAIILRIVQNQRSSFFCPQCQKK